MTVRQVTLVLIVMEVAMALGREMEQLTRPLHRRRKHTHPPQTPLARAHCPARDELNSPTHLDESSSLIHQSRKVSPRARHHVLVLAAKHQSCRKRVTPTRL
jgi:hypothetical protein